MHGREPIGHESRTRAEQFGKGLLVAIEQKVGSGLLRLVGHYDPAAIVVRLAFNAELKTSEPRPEQGKVSGDAGRNVDPLLSGCVDSHCIDLICGGMQDETRAI